MDIEGEEGGRVPGHGIVTLTLSLHTLMSLPSVDILMNKGKEKEKDSEKRRR
jgi:hypothetical protein